MLKGLKSLFIKESNVGIPKGIKATALNTKQRKTIRKQQLEQEKYNQTIKKLNRYSNFTISDIYKLSPEEKKDYFSYLKSEDVSKINNALKEYEKNKAYNDRIRQRRKELRHKANKYRSDINRFKNKIRRLEDRIRMAPYHHGTTNITALRNRIREYKHRLSKTRGSLAVTLARLGQKYNQQDLEKWAVKRSIYEYARSHNAGNINFIYKNGKLSNVNFSNANKKFNYDFKNNKIIVTPKVKPTFTKVKTSIKQPTKTFTSPILTKAASLGYNPYEHTINKPKTVVVHDKKEYERLKKLYSKRNTEIYKQNQRASILNSYAISTIPKDIMRKIQAKEKKLKMCFSQEAIIKEANKLINEKNREIGWKNKRNRYKGKKSKIPTILPKKEKPADVYEFYKGLQQKMEGMADSLRMSRGPSKSILHNLKAGLGEMALDVATVPVELLKWGTYPQHNIVEKSTHPEEFKGKRTYEYNSLRSPASSKLAREVSKEVAYSGLAIGVSELSPSLSKLLSPSKGEVLEKPVYYSDVYLKNLKKGNVALFSRTKTLRPKIIQESFFNTNPETLYLKNGKFVPARKEYLNILELNTPSKSATKPLQLTGKTIKLIGKNSVSEDLLGYKTPMRNIKGTITKYDSFGNIKNYKYKGFNINRIIGKGRFKGTNVKWLLGRDIANNPYKTLIWKGEPTTRLRISGSALKSKYNTLDYFLSQYKGQTVLGTIKVPNKSTISNEFMKATKYSKNMIKPLGLYTPSISAPSFPNVVYPASQHLEPIIPETIGTTMNYKPVKFGKIGETTKPIFTKDFVSKRSTGSITNNFKIKQKTPKYKFIKTKPLQTQRLELKYEQPKLKLKTKSLQTQTLKLEHKQPKLKTGYKLKEASLTKNIHENLSFNIPKLKTKSLFKHKIGLFNEKILGTKTRNRNRHENLLKNQQGLRYENLLKNQQGLKYENLLKNQQGLKYENLLKNQQGLRYENIIEYEPLISYKNISNIPNVPEPIAPTTSYPPMFFGSKKRKKKKNKISLFKPYKIQIRSFGKWTNVRTSKKLNYYSAWNKAAEIVDTYKERSFRLLPSVGRATKIGRSFSLRKSRFYNPSKTRSKSLISAFIEKTKYAINTKFELAGITYKGILAKKKKAKKKSKTKSKKSKTKKRFLL